MRVSDSITDPSFTLCKLNHRINIEDAAGYSKRFGYYPLSIDEFPVHRICGFFWVAPAGGRCCTPWAFHSTLSVIHPSEE